MKTLPVYLVNILSKVPNSKSLVTTALNPLVIADIIESYKEQDVVISITRSDEVEYTTYKERQDDGNAE